MATGTHVLEKKSFQNDSVPVEVLTFEQTIDLAAAMTTARRRNSPYLLPSVQDGHRISSDEWRDAHLLAALWRHGLVEPADPQPKEKPLSRSKVNPELLLPRSWRFCVGRTKSDQDSYFSQVMTALRPARWPAIWPDANEMLIVWKRMAAREALASCRDAAARWGVTMPLSDDLANAISNRIAGHSPADLHAWILYLARRMKSRFRNEKNSINSLHWHLLLEFQNRESQEPAFRSSRRAAAPRARRVSIRYELLLREVFKLDDPFRAKVSAERVECVIRL